MKLKSLSVLFFSVLTLTIAGCGGSGGGGTTAAPTQATVIVALSGTATFGGATIIVDNAANKGFGIPSVTRIGIGSTADIFAANTNVTNQVTIGLAWSSGTPAGNIVTLVYPITAGNIPQASDFTINSATDIKDSNSQPLPTTAATLSVSIQ